MQRTSLSRILFILLIALSSCKKDDTINTDTYKKDQILQNSNYIFEKIPSKKSGINFSNTITHNLSTKTNLFDYDYFYNGSGVATGDLNNDGLLDVVFTANQGENKIYLNKGNLVFEDITQKANINLGKNWSNGITLADVNNDGWLDIYISQGGPFESAKRQNLLFINQKDLTFKEEASNYGLNDGGISSQSAFFDYDKDGDLDCIVMNESEYYGYDPDTFYKINKDKKILRKNSSHFYENRNGKFYDITEEAGLLRPSFGLGLVIADINNDSWLDIYMSNDYYVPDAMYINNKKGSFTNDIKKATKQVSFYGMGADIADINNDNKDDIFVLDMAAQDHIRSKTLMASMNVPQFELLNNLGLQTQYMYNSLQLNLGNNQYHNIGQYLGLSKTDWSWAGLIFDVDNDEKEDIYVTNGYRRYALDNDSRMKIQQLKRQYRGNVPAELKEQVYNNLPSEKISNILFKNKGDLKFENKTATSGLNEASFSNGAAYADLDNDGDLDIIVNNMDSEAFLYKNLSNENTKNNYLKIVPKGALSESFVKAIIHYANKTKTKESRRVRGYLSAVDNSLYFGLGKHSKVDKIEIYWPSGKYEELLNVNANTTITIEENKASKVKQLKENKAKSRFKKESSIAFSHKENTFNDFNKEVLLPYKQSTIGPFISKGDVNGDQLEDIYIGGAKGQAGKLYINTKNGFKSKNSTVFTEDAKYEDMESVFFDIDGDGDNDLYVTSGGSEFNKNDALLTDRIYLNDGKGNFSKHQSSSVNELRFSGKSVTKIDFDKDGDQDIILGNRIVPQHYPFSQPSIVFENDNGALKNVTNKVCGDLNDFGIINKIIVTDFDNDGWQDFIAVGEWTHIGLFKNNNGVFKDISAESKLDLEKGWWFSVVETDLNKDGLKDYIIGNVGTNSKYKAKPDKPLRVYADDFDLNGTHDVVLSYKYNDTFVPLRGKECSTQQMPFISQKIPSFQQFANSSLEDIYGDKIHNAYQKEVNQFKSLALINTGNGKFKKVELPALAQTMPIIDSDVLDFNNDGYEDVIIVGNIYNTEVETPRLDNSFALILQSNQVDGYKVISPEESGLYTEGNVKSVKIINQAGTKAIIGVNNGKALSFKLQK